MADITKCTGTNCPSRNQCKRFIAPDHPYKQMQFSTPPLQPDGTCEMYWGVNQVSIMEIIEEEKKGNGKKTTCEN